MTYRILRGDVLSFARHYHGPLFHALIADSPYNLESISKRFKNPSHKDYEVARSNPYRRTSGGFMNAKWDSDIAFHPETWEAFWNLLYPGAFIMVFGGSRTSHRLACAIEDAVFSILPSIFGWVNGQSFPKSSRVDLHAYEDGNSRFCQCGHSPRQWTGHDFQDSVPDGKSKSEDYQSDYPTSRHLYDEQPLLEEVDDEDSAPLQGDALKHIHSGETLPDIQEGIEPSHIPYQAQYNDHLPDDTSLDVPTLSGDASQSSLVSANEKGRVQHSRLSNEHESKRASSQTRGILESDTLDSNKQSNGSSVYTSRSGSLGNSSSESSGHNTTQGGICQVCGKPIAEIWSGHRYGGQVLKNALEPIIVAQKPYDGRPIDNITMTGAGALNIDAGRIGTVKNVPVSKSKTKTDGIYGKFAEGGIEDGDGFNPNVGRWPANFILQHSPQCKRVGEKRVHGSLLDHDCESGGNMFSEESGTGGFKRSHKKGHTDSDGMETVAEWECVPECAVRKLGEQSGTSSSNGHRDGGDRPYTQEGYRRKNSTMYQNKTEWDGVDDSGTASRFFYNSSWEYEQQEPDWNIEVDDRLLEADPVRYEAKASTAERNVGLDCYLTVKYTSGKEISRIWEGEKTGLAELLRRVIYEFGITMEKNLNIAVSGGIITVLCHRDILSTTKTAISKI